MQPQTVPSPYKCRGQKNIKGWCYLWILSKQRTTEKILIFYHVRFAEKVKKFILSSTNTQPESVGEFFVVLVWLKLTEDTTKSPEF